MAYTRYITALKIPGPNGTLPVPHQLLHKNTTTVNQILGLPGLFSTFSKHDLRCLRIVALTASSMSIVSCACSIFFLLNIDRRRRMFRHDLILFLFICDLVKALVLMIYPLVILVRNDVYSSPQFFNTLGWFTAYGVEGADLAIFFFAIHFALLIFKPSWKWRNKRSKNMEGGLYQFRAFIWPITALVPVALASLAFVNFKLINTQDLINNTTVVLDNNNYHFGHFAKLGGYKPYSAWCYLPPFPLWYKLVLSWGPRYFLIVFIFVLYLSIYIFVRRQSSRIKSQIYDFKHREEEKEMAKVRTTLEMILWRMKKYLLNPLLHLFRNLKNFFFLSLEDTSDSSRGRSIASSVFSFRADDNSSCNNRRSVSTRKDGEYFGRNFNDNFSEFDRGGFVDGSKRSQCSSNLRMFKSLTDLRLGEAPTATQNAKRISITGITFNHHSENDIPKMSNALNKNSSAGYAGQNRANFSLENALSAIPSFYAADGAKTAATTEGYSRMDSNPNNIELGNFNDVQASFQKQTYADMKKRRLQIQKNLRSIFVYPFSYIAIWIFPLIVDATQYHYEVIHGPVVWLVYLATIAQPLNGFVDTIVFLYREKPWKYSWRDVHTKELMEKFSAKGDMDDKDIYELYNSDWGRKGWYYCGRFKKKECWRHKSQPWKHVVWYVYRFLMGLIRNNYSFEDNCDDTSFWARYYLLDRNCSRLDGPKSQTHERQLSFPSDSTSTSDDFISGLNYVEIPAFWKLVHLFSMLKGIDLDELNRQMRLKTSNDDFTLSTAPKVQFNCNKGIFKPNYSLEGSNSAGNKREQEQPGHSNTKDSYLNNEFNFNTDFSDVVKNIGPDSRGTQEYGNQKNRNDDDLDMLAFLKGSSSIV